MGDQDHAAREGLQVVLQPGHRLRVQMVGGFVQQQHVGLGQQQPRQRHPALLAPRQLVHGPVGRRAAQRLHGLLDPRVDVPQIGGVDLLLERGHLLHQRVGIVLRHLGGDLVVAVEHLLVLALRDDVAPDVQGLVQVRLLLQVAHLDALGRARLAGELGVEPRQDLQQGRLARPVDAHHADLGVRVEGQPDVLEHLLAAGEGLGQALHLIDVLGGHAGWRSLEIGEGLGVAGHVAAGRSRRNGRVPGRRAPW